MKVCRELVPTPDEMPIHLPPEVLSYNAQRVRKFAGLRAEAS
jgi:hypothetical protein